MFSTPSRKLSNTSIKNKFNSGSAKCFPSPADNFPIPQSKTNSTQDLLNVFHPQQTTFQYLNQKQIHFCVLKCRSKFLIELSGEKFQAYNFSHVL
jgi:hypothetical protein